VAPAGAETPFEFQQRRKRADALPGPPIQGFGPKGGYTLWLPAGKVEMLREFRNGRVASRQIKGGLDDPELIALQRQIIDSAQNAGPGRLLVDVQFLDFAAGLVRRNYTVTDDELGMLLLSGNGWHKAVWVDHVLGGQAMVEALADSPAIDEPIRPKLPPTAADLPPVRPWRRPWWQRLAGRLNRGG
jgi:hypothetical protein